MKTIRKILVMAISVAMLLSLAACGYTPAKEYKTVTVDGLNIDIRSDMEPDDSLTDRNGEKVYAYLCKYFGMNIASTASSAVKYQGYDNEGFFKMAMEQENVNSEIKKFGDICYIEYKQDNDGDEYLFTSYLLDLGYNYYIIEFYTPKESSEEYIAEYEKIISSAKLAEEPAATAEITTGGVKMTVDGDADELSGDTYLCSRYAVSAFTQNLGGMSAEQAARTILNQNDYVTADGATVQDIQVADDGMASFESYTNEQYVYHYLKKSDYTLIYITFMTVNPADDALKTDFASMATEAALA